MPRRRSLESELQLLIVDFTRELRRVLTAFVERQVARAAALIDGAFREARLEPGHDSSAVVCHARAREARMSKCILNRRTGDHHTWCGRDDSMTWSTERISKEFFLNVDAASARPDGDVCLKCASAVSRALRGTDPTIDIDMDEGLFKDVAQRAQALVLAAPTSERVFIVAATIIQVAAQLWVRYHQPEEAAEFLPLDDERFMRLAGSVFGVARQSRN